ncbi:MAG: hypothetical protein WC002_08580, partial [Candidatus Muiribacteriota bacterium]
ESNFIDIIPFFPQLPRPRTFGKDTWKDIIAATDIDGNNVQVEISNEIVKIDTDNKICTISGRGHNFERTYLVVRNTDFDYEKGEIINSNLRVGYVNKKDNTRLVSEMTMQRVERK